MIVFVDENMPPALARGLQALQEPLNIGQEIKIEVKSIKEEFGKGVDDEVWIPLAGKQHSVAITQDINIKRTRHQRELCEKYRVSLIVVRAVSKKKGLSYWDMTELLVRKWLDINRLSRILKEPVFYELKNRSGLKEIG